VAAAVSAGSVFACVAAPGGIVSILPYDRRCRLKSNRDTAALVDKGALGGNSPNDILGS